MLLAAQTNDFEYTQFDTVYTGDSSYVELHGEVVSFTSSEQNISVTPVELSKPDSWLIYYCVGPACIPLQFAPSYTHILAPGDTAAISLEIRSQGELGEGSWMIFVVDSSSMEIDSAYVRMEYLTTSIDKGFNVPKNFQISNIYPNPVNAQVNVNLQINETGDYLVKLVSLTGRSILERKYSLSPGMNHFSWNVSDLHSGNYLLTVSDGGNLHTQKVVIVK